MYKLIYTNKKSAFLQRIFLLCLMAYNFRREADYFVLPEIIFAATFPGTSA